MSMKSEAVYKLLILNFVEKNFVDDASLQSS